MRMLSGKSYLVTYRLPGQRVDHQMRAIYLGTTWDGDHTFSGRPEFGTTVLMKEQFIKAEAQEGKPFTNRRAT